MEHTSPRKSAGLISEHPINIITIICIFITVKYSQRFEGPELSSTEIWTYGPLVCLGANTHSPSSDFLPHTVFC